jgi:hypothetical protein
MIDHPVKQMVGMEAGMEGDMEDVCPKDGLHGELNSLQMKGVDVYTRYDG